MRLTGSQSPLFVYGTQEPRGAKGESGKNEIPLTYDEQAEHFVRHLGLVLMEIASYGFGAIAMLPGHGPTTSFCGQAAKLFAEQAKRTVLRPVPRVEVFAYLVEARAIEPNLKDLPLHADKIETSILLESNGENVHREKLPKSKDTIPGAYLSSPFLDPESGYRAEKKELWNAMAEMDPRQASVEYGRTIIDYSVRQLSKKVKAWSPQR